MISMFIQLTNFHYLDTCLIGVKGQECRNSRWNYFSMIFEGIVLLLSKIYTVPEMHFFIFRSFKFFCNSRWFWNFMKTQVGIDLFSITMLNTSRASPKRRIVFLYMENYILDDLGNFTSIFVFSGATTLLNSWILYFTLSCHSPDSLLGVHWVDLIISFYWFSLKIAGLSMSLFF